MQTETRNLKRGDETPAAGMAPVEEFIALGESVPADGWVADEQLQDTIVSRNPLQEPVSQKNLAANALASGRRTVRLLWVALVGSLAAHLVIPVCLVTAMMRPEKVALMDGTESLIIAPLVPLEETIETEEESPKKEPGAQDAMLEGSVDRLQLQRAIENLPPGYRTVFVLHDVEGYEHKEIADMLGCTVGNSKSQLHKARLRLRALLRQGVAEEAAAA